MGPCWDWKEIVLILHQDDMAGTDSGKPEHVVPIYIDQESVSIINIYFFLYI